MPDQMDLNQKLTLLWERFKTWEIPIHSLLVSQSGEKIWETYQEPFDADTPHRMFSITKSFTALAIGALACEGKLSLSDPVVAHFPEYLPADNEPHPFLAEMTLRDLLTMQTCHSATTYKRHPDRNWVESFFITPPTHKSGQIFMYDTSASHVLAALVKKLSGLGVLNYLRTKYLDKIGFSEGAYIIRDPFGSEMGGSGLVALPGDLMKTAHYLREQIKHGTNAYADYLREAISLQVPTLHSGQTLEEQQGYGYQFWRIRDGFAMYGMGSQYVLFYPKADLIFVITADSQNIKGGNQKILDAVYDVVKPNCCSENNMVNSEIHAKVLAPVTYQTLPNPGGFIELSISANYNSGCLTLKHPEVTYQVPFGLNGSPKHSTIAKYNQPLASSGQWLDDHTLFVYSQIVGECIGSLSFMLRLRDDGVTLWMKRVEETYFYEFDGFLECVVSCK